MSRQRALIVDDEPDIRELLEITLGRMKLDTRSARNVKEAREWLEAQRERRHRAAFAQGMTAAGEAQAAGDFDAARNRAVDRQPPGLPARQNGISAFEITRRGKGQSFVIKAKRL